VAKTGAVERPLMAVWRGANLPYFGKTSKNMVYSPQELKRADYRSFFGRGRHAGNGNGARIGLIFIPSRIPPIKEGDLSSRVYAPCISCIFLRKLGSETGIYS
jgi:hypothetical protein